MILDYFSYVPRLPNTQAAGQFPYNFIDQNSKILVVTIGDSWTWGADIAPYDQVDDRMSKVFGRVISNELNADFLNLGQCGSCNLHIAERIAELDQHIPNLSYEKILIICTYTEVARSLDGPYDRNIDYHLWFRKNHFTKILQYHNSLYQERLVNLTNKYSHVQLIVGNNFTDPIGMNKKLRLLDLTWLQVYSQYIGQEYTGECFILSHWVLEKLPAIINNFIAVDQIELKEWMIKLVEQASKRKQLLTDSKFFTGVNHPTAQGHRVWANYILETIQ